MSALDSDYKGKSAEFWTGKGDKLTVVGDFLGRLPAVELLAPKKGEDILDAGCGAGFVSRMIARSGARVYGCDINDAMLGAAKAEENRTHLGIKFDKADITKLPYREASFDAISCVGVLIHVSPEECSNFFRAAYRVLKPGGRAVISVTHPGLYERTVRYKSEEKPWLRHESISGPDKLGSQKFKEFYKNSANEIFESNVYAHTTYFLHSALEKSGFIILKKQTMKITKQALQSAGQSGEDGYPGYYQILAHKPK